MPFTLDKETKLIKGRKGDTGTFTFEFKNNLEPFCVHFYVKRNINDPDEKTIINKEYKNLNSNEVVVNLTAEDTKKLLTPSGSHGTYYWGLKIHDGVEYAQTVIPEDFKNPPMMYVYPGIGGI